MLHHGRGSHAGRGANVGLLDRITGLFRRADSPTSNPQADLIQKREAVQASILTRAKEGLDGSVALGGLGLVGADEDEHLYRRLTTGAKFQRRDLTPLQQDRMLEISWYLYEQNPFARRLITLMTDLILGEGVQVVADDERVQEVIHSVWNHRVNQLQSRVREFYASLSLCGEICLPVERNPVTGHPVLGYIDPYMIKRIEPAPDNILIPDLVILKSSPANTDQGESLKIIQENPETGKLEGECFFFAINKLPNSLRGRSDLLPLADWLDLYDQYMFSEVERLHLLSAFVWDYRVEGADSDQIRSKLKDFPTPKPGTVWAHNEKETLEARTPDLKAHDRSEVAKLLRTHIAGSMGFPLSYMGEVDSNKATIEGQNDIMLKTPSARQKEFSNLLDQIVRFSIEGATGLNPALYRDAETGYRVVMPEIATKDVARVGTVLSQVVTAMDTSMANKTASKQLAQSVMVALLKHLGVNADPAAIQQQIEDEQAKEQELADQRHADLVAKGLNPNPPPPTQPGGGRFGNPPPPQDGEEPVNQAAQAAGQ